MQNNPGNVFQGLTTGAQEGYSCAPEGYGSEKVWGMRSRPLGGNKSGRSPHKQSNSAEKRESRVRFFSGRSALKTCGQAASGISVMTAKGLFYGGRSAGLIASNIV